MLTKILKSALALIVLAVIVAIALLAFSPQKRESFTEFYILGLGGKADGYVSTTKAGDLAAVIVGIVNRENEQVEYHLVVKSDDALLNKIEPITLIDKQKWENPVSFALTKAVDNQRVDFILYKNDQPDPYLTLNLWVNVK